MLSLSVGIKNLGVLIPSGNAAVFVGTKKFNYGGNNKQILIVI